MKVTSESLDEVDGLSISVVVYHPDAALLARTLQTLGDACDRLRVASPGEPIELFLVDNGGLGDASGVFRHLAARGIGCRVITGHGNVGYGRGHNLAIAEARSRLHLVLNPDIDLEPHTLVTAREFFDAHPDAGLLTPRIGDGAGGIQYLCRRYPTVLDLFARGFLPASMRRPLSKRLARYEMRDVIGDASVVWEPPIVSGCFMLFRTGVLKRLGGFDPRYFLYFEDYDLSLRTHEFARVAYVPAMRVLHHGGGASRKGGAHIRMFAASAFRFFNRFGWRWW
ncbi:glycosyl transferase [Burkholderia ubonensis]|uniref:glycosyltransferase family 2 protein n=1 Tax=Burkholderia ubonensis TaxID=101571 RepID=UPI00075454D7|nr:glycosyltransferase family 2 protein [Burkholderia ubonensis]KVN58787.1 glycosyl transferase [Burkholderia ubonensis]KVR34906.1 glycosyl transferase [Burkholderia ubonensis]KVT51559.1 glycosyl transferase [Burkholderia ubonensis]KWI10076.1 glycosyl transferase [Burkholderia ubonensis]KWI30753.1 glycosyl transferase [Burkholderia ubonensis]